MKVYVKKDERELIFPRIAIMTIFLAFSIGVFIGAFNYQESFIDFLLDGAVLVLFAIVFFAFGVFFLYLLIKRPKAYKVKLVSKNTENYKGKKITYMKFIVKKHHNEGLLNSSYKCYTIGENDLIIEKDYVLKIKEFNYNPKYVEDINEYYEKTKTKSSIKLHKISILLVTWAIRFISGGMTFICLLGTVMYPKYFPIYLIFGMIFSGAIYAMVNLGKELKTHNKINKNNSVTINHDVK